MILKTRNSSKKKNSAWVVSVCLLLVMAACGGGQNNSALSGESFAPAELRAKVDKAAANPGDIITFTLEAEYLPELSLELPEISDRFSEFRIANAGRTQPREIGERLYADRWYKLQADTAGSFVIEPVEVTYTLPGGEQKLLKTPKLFVEIESLLAQDAEAEDIRDIKPPVTISHPYRLLLVILATLAAAIVAMLFGKRLFERWRVSASARKLAPRPPHKEALEALERLLKKGLIETGRPREFCFEISEIFRRYMHARLLFPAIDLTAEEIIPRIEDDGIVKESLKPLVREFLTNTDLVKFAKHQPTRDEIDKIIENTRTFINETTFAPAAEADQATGGDSP